MSTSNGASNPPLLCDNCGHTRGYRAQWSFRRTGEMELLSCSRCCSVVMAQAGPGGIFKRLRHDGEIVFKLRDSSGRFVRDVA